MSSVHVSILYFLHVSNFGYSYWTPRGAMWSVHAALIASSQIMKQLKTIVLQIDLFYGTLVSFVMCQVAIPTVRSCQVT